MAKRDGKLPSRFKINKFFKNFFKIIFNMQRPTQYFSKVFLFSGAYFSLQIERKKMGNDSLGFEISLPKFSILSISTFTNFF